MLIVVSNDIFDIRRDKVVINVKVAGRLIDLLHRDWTDLGYYLFFFFFPLNFRDLVIKNLFLLSVVYNVLHAMFKAFLLFGVRALAQGKLLDVDFFAEIYGLGSGGEVGNASLTHWGLGDCLLLRLLKCGSNPELAAHNVGCLGHHVQVVAHILPIRVPYRYLWRLHNRV